MKKIADNVAYGTEGGANLLRSQKVPFEFELKSPSVGLRISWGMGYSNTSEWGNLVGLKGKLHFFAEPLIGAKLVLKIHELIKYIPHPLAKIISEVISGINKVRSNNIKTKFEINLVFNGDLVANISALNLNTIDVLQDTSKRTSSESYVKGVFNVRLELLILGKGKVSIPWTKYKFNFGAKAEASLTAYWDAKLYLTTQEQGLYGQFAGGFSGLKGQIIVEIYVGPMTIPVYDKEDTWFEPDDVNQESDTSKDTGQKAISLPIIESL
ncbi:MAG: hypothetical protein ACK5IQ_05550 [Bacteroidales bacterium]